VKKAGFRGSGFLYPDRHGIWGNDTFYQVKKNPPQIEAGLNAKLN